MSSPNVSKSDILEIMEYREGQGLFWKVKRGRFARPGQMVGGSNQSQNRSQIRLGKTRVLVHHVVWFLFHGYWPSDREEWIDHRDGDHNNNVIENLRVCTPGQNNTNRVNEGKYSKGVSKQSGRYRANIMKDGNKFFLGSYSTQEEAAAAYEGASRVLHGEFSIFHR